MLIWISAYSHCAPYTTVNDLGPDKDIRIAQGTIKAKSPYCRIA
jgi:hypothetical protein